MKILAIETSCDETAAAVVEDGKKVLSNIISSQIALHAAYGGVIPELAAREHIRNIDVVVKQALQSAGVSMENIDAVAVTSHPGLLPALAVGAAYAKGLAVANNKPIIPINHFLGHIYGAFLEENTDKLLCEKTYPILALVASGGHTSILLIKQDFSCEILGQTIDDAAGEAFDKAAKLLNLGYPGGPIIEKIANEGNIVFNLPRALTGENGKIVAPELQYCFSFSGVKTALLYTVKGLAESSEKLDDQTIKNLAASFQEAVVDVLTQKCAKAAKKFGAKTMILCGGVACNKSLRSRMFAAMEKQKVETIIAAPKYCTDNAAMIGGLAFHYAKNKNGSDLNFEIFSRTDDLPKLPF